MKALRKAPMAAVLLLFTLSAGCSSDGPAGPTPDPDPPPLQASTWLVTSNDFSGRGITDFRLTFDSNNDDVTRIQYTFKGTAYDYDAAQIRGAGAAVGSSVDVNVEWASDNDFEFDGILTSSRNQAVGAIVFDITEGGDLEAGVGSATMTKQ